MASGTSSSELCHLQHWNLEDPGAVHLLRELIESGGFYTCMVVAVPVDGERELVEVWEHHLASELRRGCDPSGPSV